MREGYDARRGDDLPELLLVADAAAHLLDAPDNAVEARGALRFALDALASRREDNRRAAEVEAKYAAMSTEEIAHDMRETAVRVLGEDRVAQIERERAKSLP